MRKSLTYFGALVVATGLALASPLAASAHTVDDTTDILNGPGSVLQPFGSITSSNTPTYGESITVPATDTILTNFSFNIEGDPTIVFRGQVFPWNGTSIAGPALYTSDARSLTGAGTMQSVPFDTGGIQLTAGATYMLLATTLLDPTQPSNGAADWAWGISAHAPAGSAANFTNSQTDAEMTSVDWDDNSDTNNMAYTATYEAPITVTALSVDSGSTGGGTSVVITGTNFTNSTGVSFGGLAARSFVVNSATQITAVSPARAAGPVNVSVNGAGFTSPTAAAATYTYAVPVVSITPAAVSALAATGSADLLPGGLTALALTLVGGLLVTAGRRLSRSH